MLNQRDPDQIGLLRTLRGDLAELGRQVTARWGRVPYMAADPTAPPDGSVWIRSDTRRLRFRAAGATIDTGDAERIEVRARRVATQAIATATVTNIGWDTIDVNAASQLAGTTFTAASAGMFEFTLAGTMASIPANRFFAFASVNSTLHRVTRQIRNSCIFEDQFTVSVSVPLAAGDYVTLGVFHASGASINVTDAWLSVLRLSD